MPQNGTITATVAATAASATINMSVFSVSHAADLNKN
jgi:hypothetical protein